MAVIGSAEPITRRVASRRPAVSSNAQDDVGGGQVVDVDDAVDDVVVVDEDVEDRGRAEREQRIVEDARACSSSVAFQR